MAKHTKSSQKTSTQSGQSSQSQYQSQSQSQSKQGQDASQQKDAEALLKEDHRKVEGLFRQFESAEEPQKRELAKQICNELIIHSMVEEEIFYPACREKQVEDAALDEAQVEHDALKVLIGDLINGSPGSPFYDAKVTVLKEYVKHHVEEEEKAGSGIFAKARKAEVDMDALGRRLQELKQQLMQQAETGALEPPQPRALSVQPGGFNQQRQESEMSRWNETERDDRGRFMDEDDYRGGSGGRFGGGDYRGRYAQGEGEYRGQGSMRGGSQGYGSQRGGEQGSGGYGGRGYGGGGYSEYGGAGGGGSGGNREYSGRGYGGGGYSEGGYATGYGGGYGTGSGGGYDSDWDMDRGGAYGSSGGYGRAGGPGGYRGMGGYGGSGEFGGSRGGGRGFGGPGRDEQGRFMSDDENGGMRGSRGGQRGSGRGGFERERDDYGRFMSEDEGNGGGRGGSRSGSGSRGGSRGGRGGNDDNRGWFGDSRGHAEAARRGWQNRD